MSLEFLILGLIHASPKTGYDLYKVFEDDLQSLWTAEQRQIYHALHKLEEQAYVTCELVVQDGSPNKKIYSITPKGEAALAEWLTTLLPPQPTRYDWLGQVYLSNFVPADMLMPLLQSWKERVIQQRIKLEEDLGNYQAKLQILPDQEQILILKIKVLEYRFMQNYHDLQWINSLITFFENLDQQQADKLINQILEQYPISDFQPDGIID
ncbi:MAG: hypothetical protein Kow00117_17210 [Phototrophicales bacterium]